MTGEALRVVHACPGRVRLKAAKLKGAPAFAQRVAERLQRVPGLRKVEASPVTGSLLIYYHLPELTTPASMLALTEATGELFPEIDPQTLLGSLESLTDPPPPASSGLTGAMAALNAKVAALTGGLGLNLLVPLVLFGLGIRSLLRAEKIPAPRWHDYFWYGFSTFMLLNPRTERETG
ncbi:MAG: hypothetical protein K6T55_11745 [Syntrophobacterales bacterium]|nr:hypothetical protein [Syntrophobacterales bacterium]